MFLPIVPLAEQGRARMREDRFATDIDRATRASVDMNFIVNVARMAGED